MSRPVQDPILNLLFRAVARPGCAPLLLLSHSRALCVSRQLRHRSDPAAERCRLSGQRQGAKLAPGGFGHSYCACLRHRQPAGISSSCSDARQAALSSAASVSSMADTGIGPRRQPWTSLRPAPAARCSPSRARRECTACRPSPGDRSRSGRSRAHATTGGRLEVRDVPPLSAEVRL